MATWPSYARFFREGFSVTRKNTLDRTPMESGPAKQARVQSRAMIERAGYVELASQADYLAFLAWHKDTIHDGADWFDWTDPVDGVTKTARIVADDLVQEPISAFGMWRAKITLETYG